MLTPCDMTDKSAIVTGAAAGPGRATALLLAGAGADVCVVSIDAARSYHGSIINIDDGMTAD